jgi:ATP-dependent exoDNAse (exonuclease V) beta subunit
MRAAEDGLYQPDYLPFGDHGHRKVEARSPAVSLLGDRNAGGGAATVREFLALEASRIARLILRIHGSEAWKVQDRGGKESPWRAPRYGDIAILLPVLSRADILEDALRDHDIPYVLEGGKFYYARSEVSSAITVLRAVANPNDSVALYGALRSIFFGLSDEDLLRARIENQPFDYREEAPPESPLCRPFQILRDLHWHRHERRASESLELLLQKTGAREVLAPRGFQSLANLNKLARTLRALQGEYTFTQAVELVSAMDEEGLAESESRIMEERSDAVRVMSIHKAKGLDFPIVFVASLGMKRKSRGRNFLADFHVQKVFGLRVGPKDSGFETPGWDKLSEWENNRENAELVRLLYVALTRARDHLILSTHTKDWRENGPAGRPVPDMQGTRLTPLSSFLEKCRSEDTGLVQWIDVDALDAAPAPPKEALPPPERDWRAALERDCSQLAAIMDRALGEAGAPGGVKAAVAGAADEELAPEERSPDSAEGRAIRLGVAFHEAMERVDLAQEAGPVEFLSSLGVRHRLDAEGALQLEDMVRTALSSELLGRVRAAVRLGKRAIRELPFVRPEGPSDHKEGKMDLLFEEEGAWVLVDYKTDRIPQDVRNAAEFFREKYASQIGDYVQALRLLSVPVQSAYLLLARTGESIRMI